MTEYLVDESGEEIMITERLVNSSDVTPFNLLNDEENLTYVFSLYSNGDYTLTSQETDSTVSVEVYLTIQYTTCNNPTEYLLTKVSGYWDILDPSVMVSNVRLDLKMGATRTWEFYMVNNHF